MTWPQARERAEQTLKSMLERDECPDCLSQAMEAAEQLAQLQPGELFHGEVDGADIAIMEGAEPMSSEHDEFQVQFLETKLEAVEIQLRAGGELVGEVTVLTFNDEAFLLATMTWRRPAGDVGDLTAHKHRVCELLVREAVDLAERHGAALMAIVGAPSTLVELGFEQTAPIWWRPCAGARTVAG